MDGIVTGEFELILDDVGEWAKYVRDSYGTFEEWIRMHLIVCLANATVGGQPVSRAAVNITDVAVTA